MKMQDFLLWLYKNYQPDEHGADKNRVLKFVQAIIDGVQIHPLYSKEENLDGIATIYKLTNKDNFLKFYTEIIENYQFNVQSLLDVRIVNLINCVISHSLTDEILGATSFDETTRTICKCIEENFISQNK
jgi:hypothetical protein